MTRAALILLVVPAVAAVVFMLVGLFTGGAT